jgi:hypothetical protein
LDERENGEEIRRDKKMQQTLGYSRLADELSQEDSDREDERLQRLEGQRNEGYE